MDITSIDLDKPRYRRDRRLTDEQQAAEVEGVMAGLPQCIRCGLRVEPWTNANGHLNNRHYVCPDEPRTLKWYPPRPAYHVSSQPGKHPCYVGYLAGMLVAEVYKTRQGKFSYVYRIVFDGAVKMTWCRKFFSDRPTALRHATQFVLKNAQWEQPKDQKHWSDISNDDLKQLETPETGLNSFL